MITTHLKAGAVIAVVATCILCGCGTSESTISGSAPEARLNPVMSAQQKAVLLKHKRDNGDIPPQ